MVTVRTIICFVYNLPTFKSTIVYSTQVQLVKVQGVLQSKTPEITLTTLSRCVSFVIAAPDRMQISVPSTHYIWWLSGDQAICIKIPFQGKNHSMKARGIFRNVLCKWEVYLRLYRPLLRSLFLAIVNSPDSSQRRPTCLEAMQRRWIHASAASDNPYPDSVLIHASVLLHRNSCFKEFR